MEYTKPKLKGYAKNAIDQMEELWTLRGQAYMMKIPTVSNPSPEDDEIFGEFAKTKTLVIEGIDNSIESMEANFVELGRKLNSIDRLLNSPDNKYKKQLLDGEFGRLERRYKQSFVDYEIASETVLNLKKLLERVIDELLNPK